MEEKELEFFKELLNTQLEELLNRADYTVAGMRDEMDSCALILLKGLLLR